MGNNERASNTALNLNETSWPSVSLLILNWNGKTLLEKYLASCFNLDYPNYQVVIVDNHSTDGSVNFVQDNFPQAHLIINEKNLGFGPGLNAAVPQVDSDIIVFLNTDVSVKPNWLTALIRPMKDDPAIGITGCKLLYPDGKTLQHAGASLSYPLALSHHMFYQEIDEGQADQQSDVAYVTGAAMAIARPVIDAIGLLDEAFAPFYYEEVDYCYRARAAGFRVVYVPDAIAIHHESFTMRQVSSRHLFALQKNRLRFVLRHYTSKQFLEDYLPAELERLQEPISGAELHQLRRAILAIKLMLPEILQETSKNDFLEAYTTALDQLREAALAQRPRLFADKPIGIVEADLANKQMLEEPSFRSETPLVGPLIAKFRQTWNDVSTKWYVRAIIQQQMDFNRTATRLLGELDRQDEASGAEMSLLAQELLNLQQQQTALADEMRQGLADLDARLQHLEALLQTEAGE
jgi:GT2 family glycosyltransferase